MNLLGDDRLPPRFWSKVEVDGETGCWLWTASKKRDGYGRFHFGGKNRLAHRVAYEALVGEIPKGLVTDHLCRVRQCVNPEHLEPVTDRENVLRGDTIIARQVAQTHCVHGHALAGDNVRLHRSRGRVCRACERRREAERKERGRLRELR
jgi:hypothetical protein